MAIVPVADAVPGSRASSAEFNKLIDNVEDVDKRLVEVWGGRLVTSGSSSVALLTTSGTTEAEITQLRMETTNQLIGGRYYEFNIALQVNISDLDSQYLVRVRRGSPTGTILVDDLRINVKTPGYNDTVDLTFPVRISSTISNAKLYVTVVRNAGVGSMQVFGGSRTSFTVKQLGSDTSMWATT